MSLSMSEKKEKKNTIYRWRHVARVVIEAATPLMVGSGEKSANTDAELATDANGLPFIPGSALAGVLRHAAGVSPDGKDASADDSALWGYGLGGKGCGSKLSFSEARMIGADGHPVDDLRTDLSDPLYEALTTDLPIRHHVRIGHKGSADATGKYDNRVALKGTRFCFEIEAIDQAGGEAIAKDVATIIANLAREDVRIGGGTRDGYGAIELVSASRRTFDLKNQADLTAYAKLGSRLTTTLEGGEEFKPTPTAADGCEDLSLRLTPHDFFLFGSGKADISGDADMTPVTESVVEWNDGKPVIVRERVLVPGSSVKGALAHRTAFYYNKLTGVAIDPLSPIDIAKHVGSENEAVRQLFGYQGGDGKLHCGKVIISDVALAGAKTDKLLNHVAIDRFTSGALAGALFTERVTSHSEGFDLRIVLTKEAEVDPLVRKALLMAVRDLGNGMLPLGGGVGRGNGVFQADEKTKTMIDKKLAEA